MNKPYKYVLKIWATCVIAAPLLVLLIDRISPESDLFASLVLALMSALIFATPFCVGVLLIMLLLNKFKLSVTFAKLITSVLAAIYLWFVVFYPKRDLLAALPPLALVFPLGLLLVFVVTVWIYKLKESTRCIDSAV